MVVYRDWNRTDSSPKRASEPDAEFLDRIAGPFWDQVRGVINDWVSHFPAQAQSGLRSRLLDRNSDANVFSALWELYLHEMLLGSGCTVQVEHQVGTNGKNPDFLVTRGGDQFVVEAIWTAQRLSDTSGTSLPPQLSDAIDRVPSPNFFLSYTLNSVGPSTPSQRRLKTELTRWLASLDPDQVIAGYERKMPLPRRTWREAGWSITFEAIPRSPGRRGDPTSRTIGVHAATWVDESNLVLDAVKRKGGKYGDLELPFIVAVGHAALFPEDEDTENALYGTSVEYVRAGTSTFGRKLNGYWTATYDHDHSRVSGVLLVDNPAPWTWTKNAPVLWQSPDSKSLPAPVLPTWATAQLGELHVVHQPAAHPIHTALGLPKDWPAGDAFPRRHHSDSS
ncbi:hypothetical protein M2163_005536 [Streptomyces sp. SAI-135]|uniref:hypothetical protein n=1 Tax=unclassified Streptomyces TaxID=2593676 RepID=UPI0024769C72|nr:MULTISPECIES: hypothetical protein [unclassified Streptomyces]MDH6517483.1 hypothetical protein [Streptomyces sp. SAI-090]MDH6618428.1 hypothetical protein [Streptomyces sp. SAI-135]